jgi:DNA-binding transcriptional ArsR family regulator
LDVSIEGLFSKSIEQVAGEPFDYVIPLCELTAALDLAQPKISRHLALLRGCGLLEDRRNGQWVYYRLHPQLPRWARDIIKQTLDNNAEWLRQDVQRLWRMRARTGVRSIPLPRHGDIMQQSD